jgi:hypothetical protein
MDPSQSETDQISFKYATGGTIIFPFYTAKSVHDTFWIESDEGVVIRFL